MKKKILSLLIVTSLGLTALHAQITVESDDVVGAGVNAAVGYDTLPGGTILGGAAGANQTWDFSALVDHDPDTTFFVNADWLPLNSEFPTANIGLYNKSTQDEEWQFLKKDATTMNLVGNVEIEEDSLGNEDTISFEADIPFITFPSTMGTTFSASLEIGIFKDSLNVDFDGPGPLPTIDSFRITGILDIESEIDAWGVLETPIDTYDVVRQNVIQTQSGEVELYFLGSWQPVPGGLDTLFDDFDEPDTTYSYRWWTNDKNVGFPIVSFEYDVTTGEPTDDVEWLKSPPTSITSVNEVQNEISFSVYPNPAQGQLNIRSNSQKNGQIQIVDLAGKIVLSARVSLGLANVDLSLLSPGMYIYTISDMDGTLLKRSQLSVVR